MLLPAVSVLVVAQSSSEIPEGLTNNPVFLDVLKAVWCFKAVGIIDQREQQNTPEDLKLLEYC